MTNNTAAIPREPDRPVQVDFSNSMLQVTLKDGRVIATPLEWYTALANATPEQQSDYELGLSGIHWPDLDEDLSISGMLKGSRPPQRRRSSDTER